MATNRWLGIAKPTAAKTAYKPSGVTPGSVWKMRVGANSYQYVYDGSISKPFVSESDRAQVVASGLVDQFSGVNLGGGSSQSVESMTAELVDGDWAVVVTGTDDGKPLDVEVSVSEPASANVSVTVLQPGRTAQNAKQVIRWPKTPTGGNLIIGYEDDVATVAYNAAAGTLETAIEGMTAVGSGNVSVSGSHTAGYEVEFVSGLAGQEVSLLRAHSDDATGTASVKYDITQQGGQTYTSYSMEALSGNAGDILQFTYGTEESHLFSGASDETAILSALESVPSISSATNVAVDKQEDDTYVITLAGEFVGLATDALTVVSPDSSVTVPAVEKTSGTTEPVATILEVTLLNLPSGGSVDFIYDGTTNTVTYGNLTVGNITTAVLPSWNCTALEKTAGQATKITLQAVATDHDHGIVQVDVSSMTGCLAMDVRQTQRPLVPLNEIQQVALQNDPDGGTFTLTYGANTTAGIAYNAAASAVDSALEAIASIGAGDVSVEGSDGGPWTVEFTNSLAATDVNLLAGNGSSLTIAAQASVNSSVIQSPTGPNWWTNSENWSLEVVPDSDDLVVFDVGDIPCQYGIEGVAAIAGIYIYRGYTGQLGLPEFRDDGTPETLQRYLSLSDSGSKISVQVGLGEQGEGPSLVRIDTQSQEADVRVLYTQTPADGGYTVGVAGDLATVQVASGSVGIAVHQLLTATVDSLRVSPSEQDADGTRVDWGENAVVTSAEVIRGNVAGQSTPGALTVVGANSAQVQGAGTCNQLTVRESTVQWLASGGIGKQGTIESIDVASTLLEITSTAHGLSSGDRVFVAGFDHLGVPDGYYSIERSNADSFVLIGSAPAIPYGASTPSTVSSYYEASTLMWGLANTVRLGDNAILDMGRLGEIRTIPAPVELEATTARVLDPQITVSDLRMHADPGYFDDDFGLNGVYRRENGVSSTVMGGSYTGPGILDAP